MDIWITAILELFLAGASLTSIKILTNPFYSAPQSKSQLLIGSIIKPSQTKAKSIKIILKVNGTKHNNGWENSQGKIIIYLEKDSLAKTLSVGDVIAFEPKIEEITAPKNPNEFNFKRYLSYHFIHQQAFLKSNEWIIVRKESQFNILRWANDIRSSLISILQEKGLEGKELAVASALILGYKNDIDAQLKNSYSSVGAMHVLAVSGLHVGIIFIVFSKLLCFLERFKWGHIIKGSLIIILLWMYAIITGLSPSVMRAATMFSFIITAKTLNRNSNIYNTLAASALVLLIYNPLLIMEVGFQLSYLAVIGIIIIQPWINDWFTIKYWLPKKLWEITAVSLAAQIATFPLGLLYFHQFPNYFLLSNLIVIPIALTILCLGIITLCVSFIPLLSDYLSLALNYLVKSLNFCVSSIDKIPYALSDNIKFTIADSWLIYFTITSFSLLIVFRKFKYFVWGCGSIIIFLIFNLTFNIQSSEQKKLFIYNIPQHSAINFIDGRDNILIADTSIIQNKEKLLFHIQNNWINHGVKNEKIISLNHLKKDTSFSLPGLFIRKNYLQYHHLKIGIIDNFFQTSNNQQLNCDLLILTNNSRISIKKLLDSFNVKQIIIDASNSNFHRNKWIKELELLNVKYWDVMSMGAFELEL